MSLALASVLVPAFMLQASPFELVELADGVHAALVRDDVPSYAFANSVIIEDDEGLTVVDTQQSPAAAAALLDELAGRTDKPVRYVINTHWHGDHVYGNQVYRERFPDVLFVGHRSLPKEMAGAGRARLGDELRTLPERLQRGERWLETGVGPDGDALSDEMRARVETSVTLGRDYLAELQGLRLVPPDITFARELVLRRPGRTIRLLHFGPGHTRGDVVVHLPDDGIAAVGDLLEEGAFPYFGDAYPAGWARALNGIGALGASIVVPSHGGVQRDPKLLQFHFRLIAALQHEVGVAVMRELTLEQAQETITLEGFLEGLAGAEDAVRTAVERAYREDRGELSPEP